jgi:hypothetical protein
MIRVLTSTRRLADLVCLAIALAFVVSILNGCTSVAGSAPVSLVRVIDASYNAPALDAYVSGVPIALKLVAPILSNYAYAGPGAVTVKLDAQGTSDVLQSLTGNLLADTQYSIFVTDMGKGFTATLLTDQSVAAPAGDVTFRFLQQANVTGAVDVYVVPDGTDLTKAKPLFTALAPGSVTKYVTLAAADYDIAVAPTGTTTGAYISTGTTYTGGQVQTVLILDEQLLKTPPVTILVANDVE